MLNFHKINGKTHLNGRLILCYSIMTSTKTVKVTFKDGVKIYKFNKLSDVIINGIDLSRRHNSFLKKEKKGT